MTQKWYATLSHPKMHTNIKIWNSYLKEYRRYVPDTKQEGRTDIVFTIKTKSEVKVTVTRKWYATLRHPKMHRHTKFGIPNSKNVGDMQRTRKRDGRTERLLYASQSSFGGLKKESYFSVTHCYTLLTKVLTHTEILSTHNICFWFRNMKKISHLRLLSKDLHLPVVSGPAQVLTLECIVMVDFLKFQKPVAYQKGLDKL